MRRGDNHSGGSADADDVPREHAVSARRAGKIIARTPRAAQTRAVSSANASLLRRASYPMITPGLPHRAPPSAGSRRDRQRPGGPPGGSSAVGRHRPRHAARRYRIADGRRNERLARRPLREQALQFVTHVSIGFGGQPAARARCGNRSWQERTQLHQGPGTHVGDHFGRGDRTELGAVAKDRRRVYPYRKPAANRSPAPVVSST